MEDAALRHEAELPLFEIAELNFDLSNKLQVITSSQLGDDEIVDLISVARSQVSLLQDIPSRRIESLLSSLNLPECLDQKGSDWPEIIIKLKTLTEDIDAWINDSAARRPHQGEMLRRGIRISQSRRLIRTCVL